MPDTQHDAPDPRKRVFKSEIRLGDLAIILSLLGPVVIFYADVTRTLGNHEIRVAVNERSLEQSRTERIAFQNEIRALVTDIHEDVAVMKGSIKNLEERANDARQRPR